MPYTKTQWNKYNDKLSLEENIANNAVITAELMNNIEDGITENTNVIGELKEDLADYDGLQAVVNQIHSVDSNIEVIIMDEYLSPTVNFSLWNGHDRWNRQSTFNSILKSKLDLLNTKTILRPIHNAIDSWYDFQRGERQICTINPTKEEYVADILHLETYGYYHIACMLYAYILSAW